MILLTFRDGDDLKLGVKTSRGVVDVAAAQSALGTSNGGAPESMDALLAGGESARKALADLVARAEAAPAAEDWIRDEPTLTLGPAVPNPGKIVCVGLNYRKHAEETGAAIPETPVLFSKFNNTVAAASEDVPLTDAATQYDYEVELAVVMGEDASNVAQADALSTVFGYATANDISARDLQTRTSQWILGKTMDKFMPIGPYLVTADEVPDPQKLPLRTWLNGELRQNSNTD
ncbi:MAG: hydrolase family protein, partial [Thermomicrobiales bacterium]|nr:hydrolase family protein [Thermomicrobiales bacterium]